MNEPVLSVEVDTLVMVREAEGGGDACVSRSFRSFPTASMLNIRKLLCRGSAETQLHISEEQKAPPSYPVSQSVNFRPPTPVLTALELSQGNESHTYNHTQLLGSCTLLDMLPWLWGHLLQPQPRTRGSPPSLLPSLSQPLGRSAAHSGLFT